MLLLFVSQLNFHVVVFGFFFKYLSVSAEGNFKMSLSELALDALMFLLASSATG